MFGGFTTGAGIGAGTGVGRVAVVTVVGGGSSARAPLDVERLRAIPPTRNATRSSTNGGSERHPVDERIPSNKLFNPFPTSTPSRRL